MKKQFNKENLVPLVTGVQFRWQFDYDDEQCKRMRNEFDVLSAEAIHIITSDGKIMNPINGSHVGDLSEYNDYLEYEEINPDEGLTSFPELDIVKVFNLAQVLAFGDSVPSVIYDKLDNND